MFKRFFLVFFISIYFSEVLALENCNWNNQIGKPCITISKTLILSYNSQGVSKEVFTRQQIIETGATTAIDI